MSELLLEKSGAIATLTFNRPEQMNTISIRMLDSLAEQLLELDRDP
ncbi:MAG: enoyl-CoA hydratase/isomerase family protein, partial [bacterium]|nr:enoyl-CoA hydratase/isomerase family protein [bacterium]